MTLSRYLTRALLAAILSALVALIALAGLLDLLDNANTVLSRNESILDLVHYALLIMPSIAASAIPVATLIGTMSMFAGLAGHNEIIAIRAAGITLYRIVAALAPAALFIGFAYFVLLVLVTPNTEVAIHGWLVTPDEETETAGDGMPQGNFWVSSGPNVLSFDGVSEDGTQLQKVSLYRLDDDGRLVERTTAAQAVRLDGFWRLDAVVRTSVGEPEPRAETFDTLEMPGGPRPAEVLAAAVPTARARLVQPGGLNAEVWSGANSPSFYLTSFYQAIAAPLVPLIMVLAAAPLAFGTSRHPARGTAALAALALGFGFLLVNGIFRSLGQADALPPIMAGLAPTAIFLLLSLSVLIHSEG
jgi:lipopolysaccharide export system permease protein